MKVRALCQYGFTIPRTALVMPEEAIRPIGDHLIHGFTDYLAPSQAQGPVAELGRNLRIADTLLPVDVKIGSPKR